MVSNRSLNSKTAIGHPHYFVDTHLLFPTLRPACQHCSFNLFFPPATLPHHSLLHPPWGSILHHSDCWAVWHVTLLLCHRPSYAGSLWRLPTWPLSSRLLASILMNIRQGGCKLKAEVSFPHIYFFFGTCTHWWPYLSSHLAKCRLAVAMLEERHKWLVCHLHGARCLPLYYQYGQCGCPRRWRRRSPPLSKLKWRMLLRKVSSIPCGTCQSATHTLVANAQPCSHFHPDPGSKGKAVAGKFYILFPRFGTNWRWLHKFKVQCKILNVNRNNNEQAEDHYNDKRFVQSQASCGKCYLKCLSWILISYIEKQQKWLISGQATQWPKCCWPQVRFSCYDESVHSIDLLTYCVVTRVMNPRRMKWILTNQGRIGTAVRNLKTLEMQHLLVMLRPCGGSTEILWRTNRLCVEAPSVQRGDLEEYNVNTTQVVSDMLTSSTNQEGRESYGGSVREAR